MSQQVDSILKQIEDLEESDRMELEERLQELAENEWLSEATAARNEASRRGIDQSTIDQAISDSRYRS
jgi:hypothetical protein